MIKFSTKDDLLEKVKLEQKSIELHISSQINLSNDLVTSTNNMTEDIFNDFTKYMINIKNNIELFYSLKDKLHSLENEKEEKKLEDIVSDYNNTYTLSINKIFSSNLEIKNFIKKLIATNKSNGIVLNNVRTVNTTNSYLEKTLIISEISKVVILPYTIQELNEKLENSSDYKNIDEIINKEYTLPLVYYKHSAISRFKEAIDLALHKEKLSYLKALSLAIEMLTNYNLHPAIITACKNMDELDVYLSCLEDNQLDDFQLFDIKYEMLPKVVKQNKEEFAQV